MDDTKQFPSPRYPDYVRRATEEDLIVAARKALNRTHGRGALGLAKPGDKVLIATPSPPDQDTKVLEAIVTAFKEKGFAVDSIFEHEAGMVRHPDKRPKQSAADGWKEVMWRDENTNIFKPEIIAQRPDPALACRQGMRDFLREHLQYTAVFTGNGGRPYWVKELQEQGHKFKTNWLYETKEDLLSGWNDFPDEVHRLIEKKILDVIPQIQDVKITDPQGTEIWFSVTKEEAEIWAKGAGVVSGHLFMHPSAASVNTYNPAGPGNPEINLVIPKAYGVIAGTSNHFGFYPHMKAYVENCRIVRLDGGGMFGELLRELMYRRKDVHYPKHPEPGQFYLHELALGTHPKAFRRASNLLFDTFAFFPNMTERNRSGVFHWGIGAESKDLEFLKFTRENGLPHEHGWHFHTLFNTYEVKLRDSNDWIKLIDKGHLTALDDPEVWKLTSRYGDPKELLHEDWIPRIPGINYPGDYMRDFGLDPANWVRREIEDRLPSTFGVPV